MSQPTFSIIIPTLDEERFLPLLLRDLNKQTYQDFEVIIVDGQSTDRTRQRAQTFANQMDVHIHLADRRHVSYQRNLGAQQARADWLIFMDADNRLKPYFLQGIRYQLDKHPRTHLFTCWFDLTAYSITDRPMIQLANIGLELYAKIKPVAQGSLIGAHRKVFQAIQFDEHVARSEDYAFVTEAIQHRFSFRIFKEPGYTFSLRRIKQDGTITTLRAAAKGHLFHLTGKHIATPEKIYPMRGGSPYRSSTKKSAHRPTKSQTQKIIAFLRELL